MAKKGYVIASEGSRSFDDPGEFVEIPLVNRIRSRVRTWREAGYPGVAGITKRLLEHWTNAEEFDNRRFFFENHVVNLTPSQHRTTHGGPPVLHTESEGPGRSGGGGLGRGAVQLFQFSLLCHVNYMIPKTYVYIDGLNLFRGCLSQRSPTEGRKDWGNPGRFKWLDLGKFCSTKFAMFTREIRKKDLEHCQFPNTLTDVQGKMISKPLILKKLERNLPSYTKIEEERRERSKLYHPQVFEPGLGATLQG